MHTDPSTILSEAGPVKIRQCTDCGMISLYYDNVLINLSSEAFIKLSLMVEQWRTEGDDRYVFVLRIQSVMISIKKSDFVTFDEVIQKATRKMLNINSLINQCGIGCN